MTCISVAKKTIYLIVPHELAATPQKYVYCKDIIKIVLWSILKEITILD